MSALQKAAIGAAAALVTWKVVDGKYAISKDVGNLAGAAGFMKKAMSIIKRPNGCFVMSWYETLDIPGIRERTMFIQAETGRKVTFQEIEDLSNRIGNWAVSQGFKPGECLSLFMENRPEFVAVWLGLAKAGCMTALINTNVKGKPLVHAMTVANSVGVIFGTEKSEDVETSLNELGSGGLKVFASFGAGGLAGVDKPSFCDASLDMELQSFPATPVPEARRIPTKVTQTIFYIYTSGTTGLPKACNMSHAKVSILGSLCAMAKVKAGETIYGSGLPLYHSAANIGVLHAMTAGSTYVIRTKFSASKHWEDCAKYGCVGMQYIGELCRYLITQSDMASAKTHKLRVAFGNGLRPEIWNQFQRTCNIPEILEFYAATEGAGVLTNYCKNYEGQGAVGWQGPLTKLMFPATIVKFDVEKELPLRDPKTGFCLECDFNEPGELINPIRELAKTADGSSASNFEGYTNKEATDKKTLKDVFKKGDLWYRSGDLLRKDEKGYYYFVDRIGDTFRWKGENVSTMEVSEVLSSFEGVVDANVYGVEIPGKDGRACMVAITVQSGKKIDPATFATFCRANLPPYSVPLFIRLLAEDINLTGTFKHQKVDYRNQGCDPAKILDDEVWWFNIENGTYEPYTAEIYSQITRGQSKL
jgi:fatty-acyl-CoA synthase